MHQSHTSLSRSQSSGLLFRSLVLETKDIVLVHFEMMVAARISAIRALHVESCAMSEIREQVSGFDKAFGNAGQYHHR